MWFGFERIESLLRIGIGSKGIGLLGGWGSIGRV